MLKKVKNNKDKMSIKPEEPTPPQIEEPIIEEEKSTELLDLLRSINDKLDNLVQPKPPEPVAPEPEPVVPEPEPVAPVSEPVAPVSEPDNHKQPHVFQKHKLFFIIGAIVIFISFFSFMDLFQNPQIFFFILIFISFIFIL